MFLRVGVYSKVMKVKLMLYDSDPNNARIIMKYNTFHSMNPIYGRERKISKSTQYYNAMHNFLSDVNANNHLSKDNLYVSFSNTSKNSKICFFNVF
jgi:hypothetical protein